MPDVSQLGCQDVTEEGVATFCGWWKWEQRSSTLIIDGRARHIDSWAHFLYILWFPVIVTLALERSQNVSPVPSAQERKLLFREGSNEVTGSARFLIQYFFTVPHIIPPGTQDWEIFEDLGVRQEQLCQMLVTAAALWNSQSGVGLIFPVGGFPRTSHFPALLGKIAFRSLREHSSPC